MISSVYEREVSVSDNDLLSLSWMHLTACVHIICLLDFSSIHLTFVPCVCVPCICDFVIHCTDSFSTTSNVLLRYGWSLPPIRWRYSAPSAPVLVRIQPRSFHKISAHGNYHPGRTYWLLIDFHHDVRLIAISSLLH